MSFDFNLYSWKPFGTFRDAAISTIRYSRAWASLYAEGRSFSNFGDELSKIVLRELTGLKFKQSTIDKANFVGVGSALNTAAKYDFQGVVIGTGLRRPLSQAEVTRFRPKQIIGVRGLLTAQNLGLTSSYAIGDPGLVASEVFQASSNSANRRAVFIPHFEVYNSKVGFRVLKELKATGWSVVPPNLSPKKIAESISSAEFVATSSLHGHVLAHSYGVPTSLINFGNTMSEPGFKYSDYLSIFGLSAKFIHYSSLFDTSTSSLVDNVSEDGDIISSKLHEIKSKLYKNCSIFGQ